MSDGVPVYFRFCTDYASPYTGEPYGIFIAVWHLIRDRKTDAADEALYWETRRWFEAHLPIPPYYSCGNPRKAITWFREPAMEGPVVAKLEIYQQIAVRYGTRIVLISSDSPGEIIYEDDFQIAAVPGTDGRVRF